jgi:tetratricopeptide (TPR) repeat protein
VPWQRRAISRQPGRPSGEAAKCGGKAPAHWYTHGAALARNLAHWETALWYLERCFQTGPATWDLYADRAEAHGKLGNTAAHEADLSKAVELSAKAPPEARRMLRLARGELHGRKGRWKPAAADFAAALRLGAQDTASWDALATLLLATGDMKGYRRAVGDLLTQFGRTEDPPTAAQVALLCLLAPAAVPDLKPVLTLADRAVAFPEKAHLSRESLLVGTLAHYRAGQYARAAEFLAALNNQESGVRNPKRGPLDALGFLVEAMIRHKQDQREAAQAALGRARAVLAALPEDGGEWLARLRCRLLLAEASAIMDGG